jgi:hypothetical protein
MIFGYLPTKDVEKCFQVCKSWYNAAIQTPFRTTVLTFACHAHLLPSLPNANTAEQDLLDFSLRTSNRIITNGVCAAQIRTLIIRLRWSEMHKVNLLDILTQIASSVTCLRQLKFTVSVFPLYITEKGYPLLPLIHKGIIERFVRANPKLFAVDLEMVRCASGPFRDWESPPALLHLDVFRTTDYSGANGQLLDSKVCFRLGRRLWTEVGQRWIQRATWTRTGQLSSLNRMVNKSNGKITAFEAKDWDKLDTLKLLKKLSRHKRVHLQHLGLSGGFVPVPGWREECSGIFSHLSSLCLTGKWPLAEVLDLLPEMTRLEIQLCTKRDAEALISFTQNRRHRQLSILHISLYTESYYPELFDGDYRPLLKRILNAISTLITQAVNLEHIQLCNFLSLDILDSIIHHQNLKTCYLFSLERYWDSPVGYNRIPPSFEAFLTNATHFHLHDNLLPSLKKIILRGRIHPKTEEFLRLCCPEDASFHVFGIQNLGSRIQYSGLGYGCARVKTCDWNDTPNGYEDIDRSNPEVELVKKEKRSCEICVIS